MKIGATVPATCLVARSFSLPRLKGNCGNAFSGKSSWHPAWLIRLSVTKLEVLTIEYRENGVALRVVKDG